MIRSFSMAARLFIVGLVAAWAAGSAGAVTPDPLLPAETDAVVTINVKALLGSGVVKKHVEQKLRKEIEKNGGLTLIMKLLGFDPFTDLHAVTIAAVAKGEKPDVLVIVRGKFDRERLHAALDHAVKNEPEKTGMSMHGGVKIYEKKDGDQPGFGAILDGATIVISAQKAMIEKAVDQRKGSAKGKTKLQKELQALLTKVDGKQTAWLAVAATEPVKEALRKNPENQELAGKLEGAVAGVMVTDGVNLDLKLFTNDPDAVKAVQAALDNGRQTLQDTVEPIPEFGPILVEILKGVAVTADGDTLRIRGEVSGAVIEKLIKKVP